MEAFLSPRPNYGKKEEKTYVLIENEKLFFEENLEIILVVDLEPKKIENKKFQCQICNKIFKTK